MATKTFKIGEYAKGGIITVEITGKVIVVIGKEWDFSTGSRRSSDQSNAKEFTRGSCEVSIWCMFFSHINFSFHSLIVTADITKVIVDAYQKRKIVGEFKNE
jgi:hypothetical protein